MQFLFEDYLLDLDRRELTRASQPIAIGPQVFDLLVHLVQNREHVVTKDNLIEVVWGGRIVSESTLTSHINAVRKAIGDTGEQQRLVRTIARKGYRFVGDVREGAVPERPIRAADLRELSADALALPDRPSIAATFAGGAATTGDVNADRAAAEFANRDTLRYLENLVRNLESVPGRKSLVYFTPGFVMGSGYSDQMKTVIAAANRLGIAMVFTGHRHFRP